MNRQPELFEFMDQCPPGDRQTAPALDLTVPEALCPLFRIGTCSWKYDSWKGLLYEPGRNYGAFDYLPDYARFLNTVEIDQWFWSLFPGTVKLPDPETVRRYADSVPDGFIFTVKAPNALTLTHHYNKKVQGRVDYAARPNDLFLNVDFMHRFLKRLAPLGRKLGPIMLQFEYLNRKKMASAEQFLEELDAFLARVPSGFKYAVETRNPNYLSPDFFDCLANRSVGCVLVEGYHMPHIGDVWDRYRPDAGRFSVLRLIGPDRTGIEEKTNKRWDRIVQPRPEGIDAVAGIVRGNAGRGIRTFVNVNNHYEGSAPLTIERLLARLRSDQ